MTQLLSGPFQTGVRCLHHPVPARPSTSLAVGLPRGGGVRGDHVPRAYPRGRGLAMTPVVHRLREESSRTPMPDHLPFWFKPCSIFGLSYVTTPVGDSRLLTTPCNPRSRPP